MTLHLRVLLQHNRRERLDGLPQDLAVARENQMTTKQTRQRT